MLDAPILLSLILLAWMAWLHPWLGVMGLIIIDTLHPQGYASSFMKSFPAYQMLFSVVLVSAMRHLIGKRPRIDWIGLMKEWRIWAIFLLWGDFLVTTWFAKDPWAAWPQFYSVSKAIAPIFLTLVFIDTREKLQYLMFTLAISVAAATLKGGYWAVMTGFHDRVYGPPGSPYEGNNEFSVAVLMTLPILVLSQARARDSGVKAGLAVLIVLSVVAVLSSWSRGALLALGAVLALLVWHSRRKWLAVSLVSMGVGLSFMSLPQDWFGRMETIERFQQDGSAQGRLTAWRLGVEYVQKEPWVGSGFEGWRFITTNDEGMRGIDWHSIYVQLLTENGIPGFILWCGLLFGNMVHLSMLLSRAKRSGDANLALDAAMLRAGFVGYAVGGAFLGIGYWSLLFQMFVIAILLERFEQQQSGTATAM